MFSRGDSPVSTRPTKRPPSRAVTNKQTSTIRGGVKAAGSLRCRTAGDGHSVCCKNADCSPDERDAQANVRHVLLRLGDDVQQLVLGLVNPSLHLKGGGTREKTQTRATKQERVERNKQPAQRASGVFFVLRVWSAGRSLPTAAGVSLHNSKTYPLTRRRGSKNPVPLLKIIVQHERTRRYPEKLSCCFTCSLQRGGGSST